MISQLLLQRSINLIFVELLYVRYIYWTDWNYENLAVIGRANLDGSDQRPLLSGIGRCGSINIDMDADRIYWVNYDHFSIQSADLDGEVICLIDFSRKLHVRQ